MVCVGPDPALCRGAGTRRITFHIFYLRFICKEDFRLLFGEKKWGKYAALWLLPNEVLFEAFKFLNRRQLTNLERVCPRFHRIISYHIGETPFLRLNIRFGFNSRFCLLCFFKIKSNSTWPMSRAGSTLDIIGVITLRAEKINVFFL